MIRIARISDIDAVLAVINDAKELLRERKSLQWQDGYPDRETIRKDIEKEWLYVNEKEGLIAGVAALVRDPDESYAVIYDGAWLNDRPYFSLHRLAVKKEFYRRGVARELADYLCAATRAAGIGDIRADTAPENFAMRGLLEQLEFRRCGVIYLSRATCRDPKRIAYQKNFGFIASLVPRL